MRERSRWAFFNSLSGAPVIVFYTFNIVLSEICAGLYLDKDQVLRSRVHDAVQCPTGDVDGPARF